MELQDAIDLCLSLEGAEETTPFGPDALVFKVGGKIFAIASMEGDLGRMNLKGEPERNIELRAQYDSILPGYHMNKRHWNTLVFDRTIPSKLVSELIKDSYRLIVANLPKKGKYPLSR